MASSWAAAIPLLILLHGCMTHTSLQTAEVLAPLDQRFTWGISSGKTSKLMQVPAGIPEYYKTDINDIGALPILQSRIGLIDRLEASIQTNLLSSISLGGKFSTYVTDDSNMALGLNYAYWDSVGSDDANNKYSFILDKEKIHDISIIWYSDYNLSDNLTLYFHPQLVHRRYLYRSHKPNFRSGIIDVSESESESIFEPQKNFPNNANFNLIGAAFGIEVGVFDGYLVEIDYLRHPSTGFSTWELALGFF